jgi:hypothetical protein
VVELTGEPYWPIVVQYWAYRKGDTEGKLGIILVIQREKLDIILVDHTDLATLL